jgi:hypothetical protein
MACVHELKIISFENETWIATALGAKGDADFDNYLGHTYA